MYVRKDPSGLRGGAGEPHADRGPEALRGLPDLLSSAYPIKKIADMAPANRQSYR